MRLIATLALFLTSALPVPAAAEPLELFNNRLFLPVTVNGVSTVALLDSGAEMSVLDDDFARRVGLQGRGSAIAQGTGAATMEARFADDVRLDFGFASDNYRTAIIDLGEVSQRLIGRNVDLIVGRDMFDRLRLRIDILGGTIQLLPEDAVPAGVRLPMTNHRGTPAIPASVEGGAPVEAVFDLGNGSEVMVGSGYAARTGLDAPGRIVERRQGGGLGGAHERAVVRLRSLTVAGREFRDLPATIDPGATSADLNLGTSVLRHFIITADFAGQAIWLEPRP